MSSAQVKNALKVATEEFADVLFSIFTNASLADLTKHSQSASSKKPAKKASKQSAQAVKLTVKPAKRRAKKASVLANVSIEELCEKLVSLVNASGEKGASIGELASSLHAETADLAKPLKVVLDKGDIVRRGERRAAKYFPKG